MNLSDFRDLPDGIEAQHPDEFLSNLFDLDPEALTGIVLSQAADLKRPPRTFEEVGSGLRRCSTQTRVGLSLGTARG